MHTWHDVGIVLPPGTRGEVCTTCPRCSSRRRKSRATCLAINVDKGMWFCHHCGWKGSLRCTRGTPTTGPLAYLPHSSDDTQWKRAALIRCWNQARQITPQDPVARYLSCRGVWQDALPAILRYHPYLLYRHMDGQTTYHPAMVAAVQDPRGRVVSLHRTYLTYDGHKANVPHPKKLMPSPTTINGAAVRLDVPGELLAVTEGIETALAVRRSAGMPVWAAISAAGMATLVVPESVHLVVICADHDSHGKGEQAARTLARRLLATQHRVRILRPAEPGTDWADGMVGEHHG